MLIIILAIAVKSLRRTNLGGKSDSLNDSVITLARIVVKIAGKHVESGLFSVNERYGEYIAVFNRIDTYQIEGFLDGYIGLTPTEISFLTSNSKIERNSAVIRIEIGRSDITYKAVMDLLTSNNSVFSTTETEKGVYNAYFR